MINLFGEKTGSEICEKCGRPLSNPISVERGIGPICSGKGYGHMNTKEKQPTVQAPYELMTFKYPYDNRMISCGIYINVAGTWGNGATVIMAEPLNYEGMSVTNAVEHIATQVIDKYNLNPTYCTFIEHYSDKLSWRNDESFAVVNFKWEYGKASLPDWRHITRSTVEDLMGKAVPEV